MSTFMVTLVDSQTGEDQRVLVEDRNPDRDWQDWVDDARFDPPLKINNPVVAHVTPLKVKHVPRKTTMPRAVTTV